MDAYSFPLAWRWIGETHSILPADVMARILPVDSPTLRVADPLFGSPEVIATESLEPDAVRLWLTKRRISPESCVYVRWNVELAIQTEWSIFCEYWDDFCYPSSDDVEIWPVAPGWLLQYRHWEVFEFRRLA